MSMRTDLLSAVRRMRAKSDTLRVTGDHDQVQLLCDLVETSEKALHDMDYSAMAKCLQAAHQQLGVL